MAYRAISPNITINTESGQLRTELLNTFTRLDGQLSVVPSRMSVTMGPVGNVAGGQSDLFTQTVNYNTLNKEGSSILIFACGQTAANANNKTLRLEFDGVELFTTGAQAFNNVNWTMQAEIVRASSTSQVIWVQFFATSTLTQKVTVTTSSVDLGTNSILAITGEGTLANDISLYYTKTIYIS